MDQAVRHGAVPGLPIVTTIGDRAIDAPTNIRNGRCDAMSIC
jgi:hypothetical protein